MIASAYVCGVAGGWIARRRSHRTVRRSPEHEHRPTGDSDRSGSVRTEQRPTDRPSSEESGERVQARPRGRRRLRNRNCRARPRRRRPPLPRRRHRGSRRPRAVRGGLGPARRRRAEARAPTGAALRRERPDRRCARRSPGRHRAPLRRVGSRQADRHLRRGGARRPRAALGDDDLGRGAVRPPRRRRDDRRRPRARGERRHCRDAVPARVARRSRSEARQGDRHLLDLHGRARAERLHLRGARRRLDRRGLRRFALVGRRRALRAAARRRPGARPADARRRRGRRLDRRLRQRICSTAAAA